MVTIETAIMEALRAKGVIPQAPLVRLHEVSNIWSDKRTLVVKVGYEPTRYNYLFDLKILADAGVQCEEPLLDEVIPVADFHAIVVRYITPDRPTRASDAESVGALLRAVHEAILASDEYDPPTKGHVFFPDDWLAQNIIIHGRMPYLVDLDLWKAWSRDESIEVACAEFLRDLPHSDDDVAAFHRGYGVWQTP